MNLRYLFFLPLIVLLVGCDNVTPDRRWIDISPATVRRNVLIEEFTGQACLNCPQAAKEISALQKIYTADRLVAVSIHAGSLSLFPSSKVRGLRTTLGDSYYQRWGIGALPHALINRRGSTSIRDKWGGYVYEEIQQETPLRLSLSCQYHADTRTVDIQTQLKALSTEVKGRLQLWLVEDSVEAIQQLPGNQVDRHYLHRHVLRTAINGDWGQETTLEKETLATQKHQYVLPTDCVPHHAWIVAFVYNASGVLQVERCRVTSAP